MEWVNSPYFTKLEMQCRCGCGALPMVKFMRKLDTIRGLAGFPFIVSSGARCAAYNATVSGSAKDSPHTWLRAADILIAGEKAYILVKLAISHGFTGIGVSQTGDVRKRFIHLDDLESDAKHFRPLIWNY